jgi:O-antigen/teichoic acid export membrane protein
MTTTKSAFGPTVTLIAARAVSFALTFFIPVVLVRIFDQATFGAYKQLFLLYVVFYAIGQVGMAESLYYFIPSSLENRGKVVMNAVIVLALAGVTCVAALAARSNDVAARLGNPELAPYVLPIAVFLLFMLITAVLEICMISTKRYKLAAWTYLVSDLLRSIFLIVPALMFRSLTALLAGAIAFAALRFVYCLGYLVREYGAHLAIDWTSLRRQLGYALPFELAIVVDTLQTNYHQYTVSHHFGVIAFATYSVGCLQIPFVELVAGPAANVMMVRMAGALTDGGRRDVLAIWRDTTRKLALVFFPLFALLLVSAREIILLLFTERYAAAIPIFMLWAAIVPLAVFQTESVLRVFALTRFILVVNVLRLVVIAGLIGASIATLGLRGAVLVTLFATAISKALSLLRALKPMDARVGDVLPWSSLAAIAAASGAAGLPAWIVKTQAHLPFAPLLFVMGSVYALSYAGLLFAFDLLNHEERQTIAGWLPVPAWRQSIRGVE